MPRTPRSIVPGLVYHLISRFVDREWFITHERERQHYLSLLGRAITKSDWRCVAYAVMSNHLHVPVVAGQVPLGSWLRRVNSPFANFMNKEHDRIGPLFVRGPRALETAPQDVARLIAYVHNNPVRAEVVAAAHDTTWTSHRAYLGLDKPPPWLDIELGLQLCGFDDPAKFDQFVKANPRDPAREELERGVVEIDASALFHDAFAPRIERHPAIPSAEAIVEATASVLGVGIAAICSERRSASVSLARLVAAHCASSLGVTGVAIADAMAITQSAASRALCRATTRPEVIELSKRVAQRVASRTSHTRHA